MLASEGMTAAEYENAAAFMASIGVRCPQREALQFGGVIGSVFVRDIVTRSDSPWFRKGATALVFADARPEPFMPVLGQTGLFWVRSRCLTDSLGGAHKKRHFPCSFLREYQVRRDMPSASQGLVASNELPWSSMRGRPLRETKLAGDSISPFGFLGPSKLFIAIAEVEVIVDDVGVVGVHLSG
jgi:hypothetical protein